MTRFPKMLIAELGSGDSGNLIHRYSEQGGNHVASHRLQFSFNPMTEYRSLILFIYLFSNLFVIYDNFSCSYRSKIFIREHG